MESPRSALREQNALDQRQLQKIPILQTVTFGVGAGLWLLCRVIQGVVSFCSSFNITYGEMIPEVDVTLLLM